MNMDVRDLYGTNYGHTEIQTLSLTTRKLKTHFTLQSGDRTISWCELFLCGFEVLYKYKYEVTISWSQEVLYKICPDLARHACPLPFLQILSSSFCWCPRALDCHRWWTYDGKHCGAVRHRHGLNASTASMLRWAAQHAHTLQLKIQNTSDNMCRAVSAAQVVLGTSGCEVKIHSLKLMVSDLIHCNRHVLAP